MKYLADAGRRDASVSQFSCQASTQARKDSRGGQELSFPRTSRVTLTKELESLRHRGKRVSAGALDVRVLASTTPTTSTNTSDAKFPGSRVGIVVPKYKQTVVKRNLLKRRLRELVRTRLLPTVQSFDILIRPLPRAYNLSFEELAADMDKIVLKLRVA